jgi:hypothetical protein
MSPLILLGLGGGDVGGLISMLSFWSGLAYSSVRIASLRQQTGSQEKRDRFKSWSLFPEERRQDQVRDRVKEERA